MTDNNPSLSQWARNIAPSPTLQVDAKAKALIAAGGDICSFGAGEPDFDTPEFIKEACFQALRKGKTKYTPVAGIPELRAALAEKYTQENGIPNVTDQQVVVSPGAKYSCYLAVRAICSLGDEAIIPSPYWVSYPEMVKLTGARPKIIKGCEHNGFKITAEQLRESITNKTRLLILNSPSNPSGAVYNDKELKDLMKEVLKAGIYVLSDEIYEYFLYGGAIHHSPASFSKEAAAATITVSGFSKTFAMTGWRLGTLVAAPTIAKAIADLQSQTTSNATTFAQYGALAAITDPQASRDSIDKMLKVFDQRRRNLFNGLNAIDGLRCQCAQGAFYLFPNIASSGLSSTEFCSRLLDEHDTAVVPGIAFGADEYVRFSYAVSDTVIEKGLSHLKKFCASLNLNDA